MEAASCWPIARSFDEIMAYQNDRVIDRYAKDYSQSIEYVHGCFDALKQFLIVCVLKPGYKVTSREIDGMWHTFILFTKNYREFCETYLGRFVNHNPFENPAPGVYTETRNFTKFVFAELDEKYWPLDERADCTSDCED